MCSSEAVQWSGGFIYSILTLKVSGKDLLEKMFENEKHCSSCNPSQI